MADKGDQYEEYNYDEGIHSGNARKGKSKKEAAQNKSVSTQGHNERKVAGNIQHGEEKRKEEAIKNMDKEKQRRYDDEYVKMQILAFNMQILGFNE